ncbi:MAG: single-stranded-DNA-specific exonuclease RecJ [Neisseria sp.]|nr:single-stranded-DNA-specific exonuclease RecJ [Neisseria sp.]
MASKIRERRYDAGLYQALTAAGNDALLSRLFAARQIGAIHEAQHDLGQLLHFSELKNIQAAARRLAEAVIRHERIMVMADYDADGATACALAVRGLRAMGAAVDYIVPNRFANGYGISPPLVDAARAAGADVLLTVDNGIAAHEAVAYAHALGMEVVVTDHHLPGDVLPDCLIVNPNQPDCAFPCKSLAGVGVMFYVLSALRSELRAMDYFHDGRPAPNLAQWLDLVALGTVADVVRLDHNNRVLVAQGLARIRRGKMSVGIRALFTVAARDFRRARAFDLGFFIGPRINAAGRLDDMDLGIRCLLCDDETQAAELAAELDTLNRERRSIEQGMIREALELPQVELSARQRTISVFGEDWHQGVIGIVAGRLREQFYRPTLAFARGDDGQLRGSGRSVEQLHLRDALDLTAKRFPHLIVKFGGHAMAAGLTLRADAFEGFQAAFEEVVAGLIDENDLIREYRTDGSLDAAELTLDTARKLAGQVWGQGFVEPSFCDTFHVLTQKTVGTQHTKLELGKDRHTFEAMIFRSTEPLPATIRAVYRPVVNLWRDQEELQLFIDYWEAA